MLCRTNRQNNKNVINWEEHHIMWVDMWNAQRHARVETDQTPDIDEAAYLRHLEWIRKEYRVIHKGAWTHSDCGHVLSTEWMCFLPLVRLPADHVLHPLVHLLVELMVRRVEHILRKMKKKRRQTKRRIRTTRSLGLRRRKTLRSQLNLLSRQKKHAELAQETSDVLHGRTLQRAT